MSTFELYMLAAGWDALEIICGIGGILLVIASIPSIISTYAGETEVSEQWRSKRKIFILFLIIGIVLWIISVLVPDCEDAVKIYSAKYGEQEIQHILEVFRRK